MPHRAIDSRNIAHSGRFVPAADCSRDQTERGRCGVGHWTAIPGLGLSAILIGLSATPAAAIPSPELIVGSLTSLSQLGALLSALLGGSAVMALRGGRGKASPSQRPRSGLLLLVLFVATLLGGLNLYQWQTESEARQIRLSATLTRPSRLPGQPLLDPTLKELSPVEQARHPLGLTTAEAEALIANASVGEGAREIIDIRESAEVEMGTFTAARAVRFPDLLNDPRRLDGKRALLICHNGNRSSESCIALAQRGVDCRFIVGGLERWISEGRSAGGFHRSSVLDARAIPAYPNNDRLLDTPDVRALVEQSGATFVDVRYPGEFAGGHLPGAINIPMRRLATAELDRAIVAVPATPVIVPCYDRRSCFFGELMGLELTRRGRDFRGRYTVPWDYVPTVAPPPHIAAALAERNLGSWGRAQRWLARHLERLAAEWGFVPVLLGLALLSRLIVLPFALKSDRDQLEALVIEPEVNRLKARLGDDPPRLARALGQLYRRHGMTPVRNLLALLGLPVLMLAGSALGDAAAAGGFALALIGPLAAPDPTHLLPVLGGLLLGIYADWALARTRRQQLAIWLGLVPLTTAGMTTLPAATALYFAVSAVLLLAQRAIVTASAARSARGTSAPRNPKHLTSLGVLTLTAAAASVAIGTKARRLGQMQRAGIRVPDGVVLTTEFLEPWRQADAEARSRLGLILARAAGAAPYAVRSSATAEDGARNSHAGVYASVTDVTATDLPRAIDDVLASFSSARAGSYGTSHTQGAIIVQRMVTAAYAGVLFTRAPDAPGLALIELVAGAGEGLVSGLEEPQAFRYGRRSGQRIGAAVPPLDLAPLLAIGREVEALFGRPQDIEWVWAEGRFAIVQSRDITADATGMQRPILDEWDRALALADAADQTRPALVRNELAELLPRPTPVTQSLIEALHASGGSVDLACRHLGLSYRVEEAAPELFPTVFGRLYLDVREAEKRAPRLTRLHVRRLLAGADGIERGFRHEFQPAFRARTARLAATEFERYDLPELIAVIGEIRDSFVTDTHVEAEIINIVTEAVVGEARSALTKAGLDPASWLGRSSSTLVEAALRHAVKLPPGPREAFLRREIGHRALLDYELASPRLAEDPEALQAYLTAATAAANDYRQQRDTTGLAPRLQRLIRGSGDLQTLKEDAKQIVLIELGLLRRALLALDRRLDLAGGVFLLSLDEITALSPRNIAITRAMIASRERHRAMLLAVPALGPELTLESLERSSCPQVGPDTAPGEIRGTRVAGTRAVVGRAFVVRQSQAEAGAGLAGFADGDILVAPFVHPAWLAEVVRAGGVVSGSGGWLSHMAIVARERDVAMIVGVGSWHHIRAGEPIRLGVDGVIETLEAAAA